MKSRPAPARGGGAKRGETTQVLAPAAVEMPIEHGVAGPGMLADTIVRRWQDHQPLNRLEGIYAREGLQVAKSTLCGWHEKVSELMRPLVEAMRDDAFKQSYLCVDPGEMDDADQELEERTQPMCGTFRRSVAHLRPQGPVTQTSG